MNTELSQPSKTWKGLGTMHDSLLKEEAGWSNFRRTIATRYFTDPDYSEDDIRYAYDYLLKNGVTINETDFLEGNPVHVRIDGKIITQDLLISAAELASMEKVIDFPNIKSFVEIGGG